MPKVDIAAETLKVGNAMTSVKIDQMILNLAMGIAWGQYELDKVGVDITKMMGVPGMVSIGGEQISMLEAGFLPSFYHFVDTILEIKMEVKIREEESTSMGYNNTMSRKMETEAGAEVSAKYKVNMFLASAEIGAKAHWKQKNSAAYSQTIDAKHSQKFSQDLSATSLMRTKLVPVPPPELLVERIKILLEKLREEAEEEESNQGFLFTVELAEGDDGDLSKGIPEKLRQGFTDNASGFVAPLSNTDSERVEKIEGIENRWLIYDTVEEKEKKYVVRKKGDKLKVFLTPENIEGKKELGDILMEKVEERILERVEKVVEPS